MNEECCGTCEWHVKMDGEYICTCDDADGFGLETDYSDCCEEWKKRGDFT